MTTSSPASNVPTSSSFASNIPPPSPLKLGGDIAADWERFRYEWANYEIAADLTEIAANKRAARFLACVGSAAHSVFRTFKFEDAGDTSDIEKIIDAFQKHCVGEANVTYERYIFHQRVQQIGENFDDFVADLRKLARTCEFAQLEDSLIRDRIVIGIRDEPTRRRLLQVKKLSLGDAVDACKASEATSRRLKTMSGAGQIEALRHTPSPSRGRRSSFKPTDRTTGREQSSGQRCSYCGRQHGGPKESCAAYGHRCRKCSKLHHFESVCKSSAPSASGGKPQQRVVWQIDDDEAIDYDDFEGDELMALHSTDTQRAYCHLNVDGRSVYFLLDCGATANILPLKDAAAINPKLTNIRPAETRLRMFDNTELRTLGMLSAIVQHPLSGKRRRMEFYVAETHGRAILGIDACIDMNLIYVNHDNICAVDQTRRPPPPSSSLIAMTSSVDNKRRRGRDLHSTPSDAPSMPPTAETKSPAAQRRRRSSPSQPLALLAEGRLTKDTILTHYSDLFTGVGLLDGEVHLEIDPSVPPVQMPPRRLPVPIKQAVKQELDAMCRHGIIEPVTEPSTWISALLVVRKPNGKIRICIDPKPLNKALKRSHYPMPTIQDVLPLLTKAKVFSTVDAKQGFWNVKLDKPSSALTCFETPWGRYRWLRMCFGISPAPELFMSKMHETIAGLPGVTCIADDILIFGSGDNIEDAEADHDRNLIGLLERCRERNLHLNSEKIQLRRPATTYMGHELTKDGVKADRRKVAAILDMKNPTDRPGVMRLLGMATYLAKFVPHFSEVTAPLRELLSRDVEYRWDEARHGKSFRQLKEMLVTAPVLCYYDVTKPVVVQADASSTGLGAAILIDGRPVEYASRAMTRTERESYSMIEKEMLAIVFAMQRFDAYVYGKDVIIHSDHRPIQAIVKKPLASAPTRLQRMLVRLQRYRYTVEYLPGSQMLIADTLSRAYLPDTAAIEFPEEVAALADTEQQEVLKLVASAATIELIKKAAAADDQYQLLRRQIALGWPASPADVPADLREFTTFADELAESDGLVFKGQRVVVPQEARAFILQRIHSSHIGVNGCIRRAKESVFYPGLTADIKKLVATCAICEAAQNSVQKEPLLSHAAPDRPWQKVGVDIFTFSNFDYLLTVDYLSGFFEVDRLPSKRVCDIVHCLKAHFARYGLPVEVCTDNSPFNSVEFRSFAQKYDFKHTTSSPHFAQSNGKVESSIKTCKRLMEKAREDREDPFLALLALRNTPSEQLGKSPAQVSLGRRTRTHLPSTEQLLASPYSQAAHDRLVEAKIRQASYYNRGARERPPLAIGDPVRTRWNDREEWRKGKVVNVLPYRSYEVMFDDGSVRRRTSKHVRVSREPPVVLRDEADETPPSQQSADHQSVVADNAAVGPPVQWTLPTAGTNTVTRSGRQVVKPAKYRDFVTDY